MQIRVDEDDKIVATVVAGKLLDNIDCLDVVEITGDVATDILVTLCSIKNRRVMVTLFTCIDFADLPQQVLDMIDIYVNEYAKEVRARCFQIVSLN